MSEKLTIKDAEELFTYAYAVVTSEILSRGSVKNRYELLHGRTFVKAKDRERFNIVRPNNDNLYSSCWTQLENTPYILELPDVTGRYILANYLDMKTDVPFSVGSKNGKTDREKYIFIYRDNKVPEGYEDYTVIREQDSRIHLLIRLEAFNEEDIETAAKIQDKIVFRAVYPEKLTDRGTELFGLSTDAIDAFSTGEYYKTFVSTFADTYIEKRFVDLTAAFGIDINTGAYDNVSQEYRDILEAGRNAAIAKIKENTRENVVESNGWTYTTGNGNYGDNYLYRAQVAYFGYGANLAEDSIYPFFQTLADGSSLYSNKNYRIRFKDGKLPEAEFFWSITLYGLPSQYLTDNELDKYMINSHEKALYVNPDGSVDILISQKKPEDPEKIPNWLPAPTDEDRFDITMRIYGPSRDQLNGKWEGPLVEEIKD